MGAANTQTRAFEAHGDEFYGPFPSWADLKRNYGAKGDGVADDTAALQRALNDLNLGDHKKTLYLPVGI